MIKQNESIKGSELFKTIYPLIKGKRILDVGCVEHSSDAKNRNPFWVHDFLSKNSDVLGIDILKEDIGILNKEGYNMKVDNAETFELLEKFDIVFAGELIEHLSNPGLFLQQTKKHLKDNGTLILTTPNTFYYPRLLGCVGRLDDDPCVNEEHTNWYSPSTIKTLLEREGFDALYVKRFDAASEKIPIKTRIKRGINKTFSDKIKGSLLVIAEVKK